MQETVRNHCSPFHPTDTDNFSAPCSLVRSLFSIILSSVQEFLLPPLLNTSLSFEITDIEASDFSFTFYDVIAFACF